MKRSISPDPFTSLKSPKPVSVEREPPVSATARDREKELADAWDLLKPAIKTILDDAYKPDVFCCTTIYRAVQRACSGDIPGQIRVQLHIFDLIKKECEPHVDGILQSLEKEISDPCVFLPLVYKSWLEFKKKIMFVSDLAMYRTCKELRLWDVCQDLFHKQLSMSPQIQDQVISGILGLITDERLGKTPSDLLKNLMEMFHGVSKDVFEKPFLDSTSKFYAEQAEQVMQRSDIS